ncbi:MAG: macro domain-containing protein [Anaeroplasmataceae bacterium]|nr:macro domain-containing protein [Anaeroplasmataceae bacterium]
MVKYLNCDCINSKCSAIVNQINLSGNMDSKEGLEFSTRFPKMYSDYLNRFKERSLKLYESYIFEEDSIKVINMLCYESFAFPTNLETIENSLKYFVKHYKEYGITEVAFPLLGCDEDGLRMVSVLPIMERYLKPLPIECYICFDIEGPSNLELQMIAAFQNFDLQHLKKYAKLDDIQLATLEANKQFIVRFEEIYHLAGITPRVYRMIYSYYYNGEYQKLDPFHQEALF